jgi:hypothetical protein
MQDVLKRECFTIFNMSVQYLLDVSIVRVLDVSKVSALVCLPREVTIEGTVEKGTVDLLQQVTYYSVKRDLL